MKKFLIYIVSALAAISVITSCDMDALVYSQMTEANYPVTAADAQTLLDGMYGYLKTNSGSVNMSSTTNTGWGWPVWSIGNIGWYGWQMITSDEGRSGGASNQYTDFTWGTSGDWLQTFQIIKNVTRMTYIIDVIDKTEGIPAEKKNEMIAEAKCLRGMFLYVVYDLFGPFHVTLDPSEINDIEYMPRPSKEEYRSWIIKDFEDALPNLPGKTNNTTMWGRLNKGFASMMLAKIHMREHEWDKAVKYLEPLLNMGYSIDPDYFAPFAEEENDENIYCIPSGEKADNELFFYTTPGNCVAFLNVNKEHSHDGNGTFNCTPYWGGFKIQWAFYDTFDDRDVRKGGMAESIRTRDGNVYTRENPGSTNLQYGAMCIKYFVSQTKAYKGDFHSVCFRYADVLMSLAECYSMIAGKPTDKAIEYLKVITDRAGTTELTPPAVYTDLEAFKTFILAERGREFYIEGWRRDDLLRFDDYIASAQRRGKNASEKHKLMPIPQRVINESNGIIEQNPGY